MLKIKNLFHALLADHFFSLRISPLLKLGGDLLPGELG